MKIYGIASEYNPFHNGHKYHIEKTRDSGATHIVSVMSGDVVQRGSIAIADKHTRAKIAVENGVDLVVEIPCPYSCASGELFAKGAMKVLYGLGCVEGISFGSETDDCKMLIKSAEITETLADCDFLRKKLSQGESYPSAISKACDQIYGKEFSDIISKPNNTLAIEYIKACKNLGWDVVFHPIKREGADHDSIEEKSGFASASLIREKMIKGEDISKLSPFYAYDDIFDFEIMSKAVIFKLKSMSRDEISELPDCTKELAIRICEFLTVNTPNTLSELYDAVKTKNITHARIRRVILYAMLGIKKEDFRITPYARVLCANDKGTEILAEAKKMGSIEISHSLARLSESSDGAKRLSQLDVLASQLQKMCSETGNKYPNEFSVKFEKL